MLEVVQAADSTPLDAQPSGDTVSVSRALLERLQAEIKFKQTKIEALNFEIARLKRWRFGSSSESLDSSTQAVLFDAIVADTRIEDLAEQEQRGQQAAPKPEPRRAVRSALPASLPRIDHHYELEELNCACGQPLKRIGEDVSEQLDCVPAQFLRNSATSAANMPACAARRSRPQPCRRRSSTKASRPRACSHRSSSPSTTTTCRCTGRKRSTPARAEPGHEQS